MIITAAILHTLMYTESKDRVLLEFYALGSHVDFDEHFG